MAHAGRRNKLLWRRDLCLNCRHYIRALPEAFVVSGYLHINRPPIAMANISRVLTPAYTGPIDGNPRWRSGEFEMLGVTVRIELETRIHLVTASRTDLLIRFFNMHACIYERRVQWSAVGECSHYDTGEFPVVAPEVFRADIWGGTWQTDRMIAAFARWDEWD